MTITPTAPNPNPPAKQLAPENGLDAETFMKLFTTQLANQNPLEPMDGADFLNQFSQITAVQTFGEMSKSMGDLKNALSNITQLTKLGQAQGLLGKNVDYTTASGSGTGIVDSIRVSPDGSAQLSLTSGVLVALDAVRRVF